MTSTETARLDYTRLGRTVTPQATTIVGLDVGLASLGYGIVRAQGVGLLALGSGVICTEPNEDEPANGRQRRIGEIIRGLRSMECEFRGIDVFALEDIAFGRNVSSALDVARVCGAIEQYATESERLVVYYTASHVKRTVTSVGTAAKSQVQFMVGKLLKLPKLPTPQHAADAFAVAITHAMRS